MIIDFVIHMIFIMCLLYARHLGYNDKSNPT